MEPEEDRYDLRLTAAYIRGLLKEEAGPLFHAPLEELTEADCRRLMALAREKGVDLHHFKRFEELPRVKAVMGFLRGVQPESLLDVGSGRGVFLFPFLRAFPQVPVTSVDLSEKRAAMLQAVGEGGAGKLTVLCRDICAWDAPEGSFDAVTLLEVLEHIPRVEAAVRNAVCLARRYIVVSVPSKPDDNPEHIHLLTKEILTDLFARAGCRRLQFGGVPGHLIMTARKEA